MADKEWGFNEDKGSYVFGDVIDDPKYNATGEGETHVDTVFSNLCEEIKKDPECAIGCITAVLMSLCFTVVALEGQVEMLRRDLDRHGHKDAVVVTY